MHFCYFLHFLPCKNNVNLLLENRPTMIRNIPMYIGLIQRTPFCSKPFTSSSYLGSTNTCETSRATNPGRFIGRRILTIAAPPHCNKLKHSPESKGHQNLFVSKMLEILQVSNIDALATEDTILIHHPI